METKTKLGADDVKQAAREAKKEIKQEKRATKQELNQEFRDFRDMASPEDVDVAREARNYAREDIKADARDGIDSVKDIRDEYLDGTNKSARKTIKEIDDVVEETTLDMNNELYK